MRIEFQYYDKSVCGRCIATDKAVERSLKELQAATAGMQIVLVEKRLPESQIRRSPSILIDGKDIERIVGGGSRQRANICVDCCGLAGRIVQCRTFSYKGKSYDHIPKEMILEAIRKSS